MTADAINPRHTLGPATGRAADTAAPAARPAQGPANGGAPAKSDRIEVSEAARALHEQIARETPPASELPPERLGELLRRLNSGYYDSAKVVDTVVARLTRDL